MAGKKRVLITGGAGFIGSHLCKELLAIGHDVLCLDNLSTSSFSNLQDLIGRPGFEFIEHDITLPFDVKIDEIYNLACPASPIHYQSDPVQTTKTCVVGAINALEIAKRCNAKILQASTSEVYGDPEMHPQPESYNGSVNPIGIRSCYDEGKRCAESLFFDYHRQYGVDIRIARIFNTYGPRMQPDDGRVVSNFIVQSLQNDDITIYGDGSQSRSFQYVDDLIKGLIALMNSDTIDPVNLGNPVEFTIKDLAEKIIQLIPESKSKIVYHDLPSDDPRHRKPDIRRAAEHLGWSPVVQLEEGLSRTIRYFKQINVNAGDIVYASK